MPDKHGYTPIHWACYNGHDKCLEVLLEVSYTPSRACEERLMIINDVLSSLKCTVVDLMILNDVLSSVSFEVP